MPKRYISIFVVMRITRWCLFIAPVIASPQLAVRGDSLVNPDWGSVFGAVTSFLGGLGTAAQNLFLSPGDTDSSQKQTTPGDQLVTDKNDSPANSARPSADTVNRTPPPSLNKKCDSQDVGFHT